MTYARDVLTVLVGTGVEMVGLREVVEAGPTLFAVDYEGCVWVLAMAKEDHR